MAVLIAWDILACCRGLVYVKRFDSHGSSLSMNCLKVRGVVDVVVVVLVVVLCLTFAVKFTIVAGITLSGSLVICVGAVSSYVLRVAP